jgi:hypothetical protein
LKIKFFWKNCPQPFVRKQLQPIDTRRSHVTLDWPMAAKSPRWDLMEKSSKTVRMQLRPPALPIFFHFFTASRVQLLTTSRHSRVDAVNMASTSFQMRKAFGSDDINNNSHNKFLNGRTRSGYTNTRLAQLDSII